MILENVSSLTTTNKLPFKNTYSEATYLYIDSIVVLKPFIHSKLYIKKRTIILYLSTREWCSYEQSHDTFFLFLHIQLIIIRKKTCFGTLLKLYISIFSIYIFIIVLVCYYDYIICGRTNYLELHCLTNTRAVVTK